MNNRKINNIYCKEKIMFSLFSGLKYLNIFFIIQLILIIYKYYNVESAFSDMAGFDKLVIWLVPFSISGTVIFWLEGKKKCDQYRELLKRFSIGFKEPRRKYVWWNMASAGVLTIGWLILAICCGKKENLSAEYIQYAFGVIVIAGVLFEMVVWLIDQYETGLNWKKKISSGRELRKDMVYISGLLEQIEDKTLRSYVAHELYTYASRARFYKYCYYAFSIIALCAPAAATVVNSALGDTNKNKVLASLLSTIATIATGIVGIVKFRESWIRYRSYCEILKREVTEFVMRAGGYAQEDTDDDKIKKLFFNNLKKQIQQEEKDWGDLRRQ